MTDLDIDELEGDLIVIQNEGLPEAKEYLAWLTRSDYKPGDNPDHDFRDMDIENLQREIVKLEAKEQYIIKEIKNVWPLYETTAKSRDCPSGR